MPYPSKVNAESILHAAVEMAERDGLEATSMRAVAQHLGLTVSSLYRYYADRAALLEAIASYAAAQLDSRLQRAQGKPDSFEQALRSYRRFAEDRPVLYSALLMPRSYNADPEQAFKKLWNRFLAVVSTVTARPDDTDAAVAVWSFVHGFIALQQSGQFGRSGPRHGFEQGVSALLQGLRAGAR